MAEMAANDGEVRQWSDNPVAASRPDQFKTLVGRRASSAIDVLPHEAPQQSHTRRNVAIGVVLVLLLAGVTATAVVVTRNNTPRITIPDQFSASFSAYEVYDKTLGNMTLSGTLYKSLAADGTWLMNGMISGTSHKEQVTEVTVIDNHAYVQVFKQGDASKTPVQQGCLGNLAMPSLSALGTAVESASKVEDASTLPAGLAACSSDQTTWLLQFSGMQYVLCVRPDYSAELHGHNFQATLSSVDTTASAVEYKVPTNVTSNEPMACNPFEAPASSRRLGITVSISSSSSVSVSFSYSSTSSKYNFPVAAPGAPDSRRRLAPLYPGSTPPNRPMRVRTKAQPGQNRAHPGADDALTCLFMHGAGYAHDEATSDSFPEYWGYWIDFVTYWDCDTIKFVRRDTTTRAFDDDELAQHFCDEAADSDNFIRNTIIFAHGSGNLIVANALSNHCNLHIDTTFWLELQPNYHLGAIPYFAEMFCPTLSQQVVPWADDLQAELNLCTDAGGVQPGWSSLNYGSRVSETLRNKVVSGVSGAMCGADAWGLYGSAWVAVLDSGATIPGPSQDTQLWSKCWDDSYNHLFVPSFDYEYYNTALNFFDITCRNGDGFWGTDRQPCMWMESMIYYAKESLEAYY